MYNSDLFLGVVALTNVLGVAALRNGNERIIDGVDTDISDHPYQVAIEELNLGQICGGALIARNLVLTAAHCLGKLPKFYTVRAGSTIREYGGFRVDVYKYINHEKFHFNENRNDYDVSVIQVTDALPLGIRIQVIPLTNRVSIYPVNYPGNFTGWGTKRYGPYYAAKILQFMALKRLSQDECTLNFNNVRRNLTDRMMCFGSYNADYYTGICKGDDGGPLVNSGGLIGIAAWYVGCAREVYHGVFVDLGNLEIYNFIQRFLADHGVTNSYKTKIYNNYLSN